MKNEHEVKLTLRLNTKEPRQRQALALIRGSGRSVTCTVVDAIIAAEEAEGFLQFQRKLEETIRDAITSALAGLSTSPALSAADSKNESRHEISDDAFDVADSFINTL